MSVLPSHFLPLRVLAEICLSQHWACLTQKDSLSSPFPFLFFPFLFINSPGGLLWGEADHRSFLKRHLLRPSAHSHAGKHPRIHLKTTENPNYSALSVFLINNSIYLVSSLWRWKITLTCKASSYWCWRLETTAPGFIILHSTSFPLKRTKAAR